jgi:sec-independent protein translocase protein TatB
MFEVGFTEIILIFGLALLVLGPEKLPGLVNKVGRWTGRARSMARQLRMQLEHEVTLEELSKSRPMHAGAATVPPQPQPEPQSPPSAEPPRSEPPDTYSPSSYAMDGTDPGLAPHVDAVHDVQDPSRGATIKPPE